MKAGIPGGTHMLMTGTGGFEMRLMGAAVWQIGPSVRGDGHVRPPYLRAAGERSDRVT